MSILADKKTKVIIQGISGKSGLLHTALSLEYGTDIVGGVTPGKGGESRLGLKVFNTVKEAKKEVFCNASVIFVPAPFAKSAILEAIDEGIELIVCITEGIPQRDMLEVHEALKKNPQSFLIGPNCPGIVSVNQCRLGIMPKQIFKKGPLGVVSRSGTLTYEAIYQCSRLSIGQSTCIGIGGDAMPGINFIDTLKLFENDNDTKAILMIGEIGGCLEEDAAEWIKHSCKKPILAYVAGLNAPEGKRMGHAGAIVEMGKGAARDKLKALRNSGVHIILHAHEIGKNVKEVVEKHV